MWLATSAPPVHVPCSTGGLQAMAAKGIFYAAPLVDLVDNVVKRIGGKFNAMHLRFEPDMGLDPKASCACYPPAWRHMLCPWPLQPASVPWL